MLLYYLAGCLPIYFCSEIEPPEEKRSLRIDLSFFNKNLPQGFLQIFLRDLVCFFVCEINMPKTQYKDMKGTKSGHQVPPSLPLDIGDREDEDSLMNSHDPSDFVDERADSKPKASSKNVERDEESKNSTSAASSPKYTSGAEDVKQWLRRNEISYDDVDEVGFDQYVSHTLSLILS